MRNADVTFDELRELLLERGCSLVDEPKRIVCLHPALGAFLFFRLYTPRRM